MDLITGACPPCECAPNGLKEVLPSPTQCLRLLILLLAARFVWKHGIAVCGRLASLAIKSVSLAIKSVATILIFVSILVAVALARKLSLRPGATGVMARASLLGSLLVGALVMLLMLRCFRSASRTKPVGAQPGCIVERVHARVGLAGNPSDQFGGKTIAVSLENFYAQVTIRPSMALRFELNDEGDPTHFRSLEDCHAVLSRDGYRGGTALLQATCKRFYEWAQEEEIELTPAGPAGAFTLAYSTNVPRQVGLAGSSALVMATAKCLLKWHGLGERQMPRWALANFVLSVETNELGINAGLMDRVIQAYEGCMYMDFASSLLARRNRGDYARIDLSCLPPLWLAHVASPSDSGKIHSDVKARFVRGDKQVKAAMATFGELADEADEALRSRDHIRLGGVMRRNFALRRKVYGDACLGKENLEMISIADEMGVPAKFSGSGGAIVGICTEGAAQMQRLRETFEARGLVFTELQPHEPSEEAHS